MKTKIIMLETKDTTPIFLNKNQTKIGDEVLQHGTFYHLYLIDPNAEIKEGDWFYNSFNDYQPKIQQRKGNWTTAFNQHKILATTDKSLLIKGKSEKYPRSGVKELPQLSQQSIKLLVDYYNKEGKMPDEVNIEYIDKGYLVDMGGIGGMDEGECCWKEDMQIKLTHQGEVDITIHEEKMYSREEVKAFGLKCVELGMDLNNNPLPRLNEISGKEYYYNWIFENL